MKNPKITLSAGRPSARAGKSKAAILARLVESGSTMKRVNFEVSAEQHAKLKVHAARTGKSIKDLLTAYVSGLPD